MTVDVGAVIAVVGCAVGVGGWFAGRDKRITSDAEWKGRVDAKLDIVVGIQSTMGGMDKTINEHGERITAVEKSTASAHKRIDEIVTARNARAEKE